MPIKTLRRLSPIVATALFLAACSLQQTVQYELSFYSTDKNTQEALTLTSLRVIERRLEHLEAPATEKTSEVKDGKTIITVKIPSKDAAAALTAELTEPFKVRIMAQTGSGEISDITVENHGSFRETGITEKDFEWVDARKDPKNDMGEVRLRFTEDGNEKMKNLFRQMKGKNIGLFVRDKLVSVLLVSSDVFPNDIVIGDVPSPELAQVFADDMNVGLYVIFTPVP